MAGSGFHDLLIRRAREEFPLAGALDIDLAPDFAAHARRYDEWLDRGFAGEMEYLKRGRDRRHSPRQVFADAQSILCVASPYPATPAGAPHPSQGPRYARYLRGQDYHLVLAEKLERVMQRAAGDLRLQGDDGLSWKVCVDTSAVLERSWAAFAGLGWIGKNTMLIHPQYGSYLLLAEALINRKTETGPAPLPDYCGSCTRCLSACPTSAFQGPRTLDSGKCVSYWTLEKRGELAETRIGNWVAGCDICQEVCPFNTKAHRAAQAEPENTDEGAVSVWRWEDLRKESPEAYRVRVRNSSLRRVKPEQFSRNLEIAFRNSMSEPEPEYPDSDPVRGRET